MKDLMQPRYKLINDYPGCPWNVGRILVFMNGYWTCKEAPASLFSLNPEKYPANFQKLHWWEHREVSEMPEYLKQTGMVDGAGNPVPDWVLKVKKHFNAGNGEWRDDSLNIFCTEDFREGWSSAIRSFTYSGFEPATLQSYTAYQQTI